MRLIKILLLIFVMLNKHFTYQLKKFKKRINITRKYCNTELKYKYDTIKYINNGEDQRYNITENNKLIVNNKEVTFEELFYKKKILDYLENKDVDINYKLEMIEKNNHLFDDKYKYKNDLFKGLDFEEFII